MIRSLLVLWNSNGIKDLILKQLPCRRAQVGIYLQHVFKYPHQWCTCIAQRILYRALVTDLIINFTGVGFNLLILNEAEILLIKLWEKLEYFYDLVILWDHQLLTSFVVIALSWRYRVAWVTCEQIPLIFILAIGILIGAVKQLRQAASEGPDIRWLPVVFREHYFGSSIPPGGHTRCHFSDFIRLQIVL